METSLTAAFSGLVDLASERVGGKALVASDEFFAPKSNLLKATRPVFIPDKFTDRGKWMDGWESRRKRTEGYDWCIIKLGTPGIIKGCDIDTSHFLGNNPSFASLEGCAVSTRRFNAGSASWKEILPKSPVNPGSQNVFAISSSERWTHIRLNIFPDGGVARLRVYGEVLPDWSKVRKNAVVDLAAVEHGGVVVAASDMFFGSRGNLIMPGRAMNMGDGWETKRRRGPGYDWVIVKLGRAGRIKRIEVDTNHFKGNFPDMCSIAVCDTTGASVDASALPAFRWTEILAKTKLSANKRHFFQKELHESGKVTHIRLNIYPDGGVSRFRVFCLPA
ncbi:MAG: allantoicase [Bacteroidota bacterium]